MHYRCIVCFESVDREVQKRSEGATLCVCGPGESKGQGANMTGVVLHVKVWIGREVCENSTIYVIYSESKERVEEKLESWIYDLERRGMKVKRGKTEYVCVCE